MGDGGYALIRRRRRRRKRDREGESRGASFYGMIVGMYLYIDTCVYLCVCVYECVCWIVCSIKEIIALRDE